MRLASGEDWLWRPMMAGLCRYESIIDGTLNLGDIAVLNELLDVRNENDWRTVEASERTNTDIPRLGGPQPNGFDHDWPR